MTYNKILGVCRGKYNVIFKSDKSGGETLLLNNIEIDQNSMIRNVFFNDTWLHYTFYTLYDRFKGSLIIKIDDIINETFIEYDYNQFFSDRGFPKYFYERRIDDGEYDLPYKIDMIKNIIKYNEKEYSFEELCIKNFQIKCPYS